jgi:alkyl hydroperoxide reductase subunit AhpC
VLTVGDTLPDFRLRAIAGPGRASELSPASFPGRWIVLLYWPVDAALVSASEVEEVHRRHQDLAALGAQALGAGRKLGALPHSVDPRSLAFPLLDDRDGTLGRALGLVRKGRSSLRATFVADPERRIRGIRVSDLSAGRFMPEVLEALVGAKDTRHVSGTCAVTTSKPKALLRMCAWCRKVRGEGGAWSQVEDYVRQVTGMDFSHGICADCLVTHS